MPDEIVYMPSLVLTGGLPEGWTATQNPGDYGPPTVADGVIHFDYTALPNDVQTGVGYVLGGGYTSNDPDSAIYINWAYNIARPELGGHVAFTVTTTDVGVREQVRLGWTIGSLSCSIAHGRNLTQQVFNTGTGEVYPWTGSCSYNLWFPNGVNEIVGPARLDFSGGGSIWMPDYWFNRYDNLTLMFDSGRDTTFSPPILGAPRDPKSAHAYISALSIEAWDPTSEPLPVDYTWAVAMEVGWHGTENLTASGYVDDATGLVYDWSMTYPVRLA